MTSAELARLIGRAELRWFSTALRRRLDDGRRSEWKDRFVARTVSLFAFWSSPSTAVCAETDKIGTAGRSGSHGDPQGANAIVLSEQAAAILQGFPPGWVFAGKTKRARWEQIGQAVPVAVAAALGRSVAEALRLLEPGLPFVQPPGLCSPV